MHAKSTFPIIDLSSPNCLSTGNSIRQACVEYGFFYLVNHGVDTQFVRAAGKELLSLMALSLNLDEDYFEKIGASNKPAAFPRLLHYPGKLGPNEQIYGASPHSDYGMVTLLVTDGVPGLQICKEKLKQPQVWENIPHVEGFYLQGLYSEHWGLDGEVDKLFISVNTSQFTGLCQQEKSVILFLPILSGDYLNERFKKTYGSEKDLKCSSS